MAPAATTTEQLAALWTDHVAALKLAAQAEKSLAVASLQKALEVTPDACTRASIHGSKSSASGALVAYSEGKRGRVLQVAAVEFVAPSLQTLSKGAVWLWWVAAVGLQAALVDKEAAEQAAELAPAAKAAEDQKVELEVSVRTCTSVQSGRQAQRMSHLGSTVGRQCN